jgi:hypothetical protein
LKAHAALTAEKCAIECKQRARPKVPPACGTDAQHAGNPEKSLSSQVSARQHFNGNDIFFGRVRRREANWHGMCFSVFMPGMSARNAGISGWLNHEDHGLRDKT